MGHKPEFSCEAISYSFNLSWRMTQCGHPVCQLHTNCIGLCVSVLCLWMRTIHNLNSALKIIITVCMAELFQLPVYPWPMQQMLVWRESNFLPSSGSWPQASLKSCIAVMCIVVGCSTTTAAVSVAADFSNFTVCLGIHLSPTQEMY